MSFISDTCILVVVLFIRCVSLWIHSWNDCT